jgi:hypothetical protein
MFKSRKLIPAAIASAFLSLPAVTNAAGLIPCATTSSNRPCTLCDFIVGIKGLMDFGMSMITIAAIAGIFFAGIFYIISIGDSGMMEKAKGFLKSALLGFIFVFTAWLIVSLTMWVLGAKTATDQGGILGIQVVGWNSFTCSTASSSGQVINLPNAGTTVTVQNCCVVGPHQCSHVVDASKCSNGTYQAKDCAQISDCTP